MDEQKIKEKITTIFENNTHQQKVLVDIYKLFIFDWDNIKEIENWPSCGNKMWNWISNRFIDFDEKHHPNIFKGGVWLNSGFSCHPELDDWEVDLENCAFVMKEEIK